MDVLAGDKLTFDVNAVLWSTYDRIDIAFETEHRAAGLPVVTESAADQAAGCID